MESARALPLAGILPPRRSLGVLSFIRQLIRRRLALISLIILGLVAFGAIFAGCVSPYDPMLTDGYRTLEAPSLAHPFGLDKPGRDVLSRVIYGGRISLAVGVASVAIATLIGVPLGIMAAYFGGKLDTLTMGVIDALYSFPSLLLALALVAGLGPSVFNIMIAIGITSVPVYCRIVRSQALSVRECEYVLAARSIGARDWRIMARHIWPNVTAPIMVQASLGMAAAVLAEAGLSFLGVGVRPPTPTWGAMLNEGFPLLQKAPWLSIYPGLAIFLVVLSLNIVGDALRDVLDPYLRRSRGTAL
ncbi:MAG: ABC transporter permease [Chloroflexota bacterium]|nr:MAG: ABC transporter permease [Chloroflexota bacterium]